MRNVLVALCAFLYFGCDQESAITADDTSLITNSATAEGKRTVDLPEMEFDTEVHDFGTITQGERVNTEFSFSNTGKSNLIISDARGSCGCTVPEWPKEPIRPGGKGTMKVSFNSEGKSGLQEKTITIVTNCEPATRIIRVKANIEVPKTAQDQN